MPDHSINGHLSLGYEIVQSYWFGDATALKQGEAVCFNSDYGTAATAEGSRASRVEKPTVSNNRDFAGVARRNYSAKTGGQMIEVYAPGSKAVPVALAVDTVIGTGLVSFTCSGRYNIGVSTGNQGDAGRFYTGKYRGRGSAIPRQTVTAVLEASMTGAWSIAADGITLTVVATAGLAAGDTVVLLGGADNGTGTVIPGKYEISSITNATTLVLTASCVDVATTALTCTGYAYTGNPTALCDLLDGEESGGLEFLNLPNVGGSDQPHMVGGFTYVCGGVTLAADAEVELAQGSLPRDKKGFLLLGTLTTSDFVVDLVTNGLQLDGSTALQEVNAIDAANEGAFLEFGGAKWQTQDLLGSAAEA